MHKFNDAEQDKTSPRFLALFFRSVLFRACPQARTAAPTPPPKTKGTTSGLNKMWVKILDTGSHKSSPS